MNNGGVAWWRGVWPDWNVRAVVSAIGIASCEMDLRFVVAMIAWAIVSLAGVLWVIRPLGAASVTSANEHSIYLLAPFLIGAGALAIIVMRRLKPGVHASRGDGLCERSEDINNGGAGERSEGCGGLGEVDADGVSMADRLAYWSAVIVIGAVVWYGPVNRSGPGFAVALVTGTVAVILRQLLRPLEFAGAILLLAGVGFLANQGLSHLVVTFAVPAMVAVIAHEIGSRGMRLWTPLVLAPMQFLAVASVLWFHGFQSTPAVVPVLYLVIVVGVVVAVRLWSDAGPPGGDVVPSFPDEMRAGMPADRTLPPSPSIDMRSARPTPPLAWEGSLPRTREREVMAVAVIAIVGAVVEFLVSWPLPVLPVGPMIGMMLLLTVLSGRNRPDPGGNALPGGDTGLRAGRDGPRSVGQMEWLGAGVAVAVMLLLVLNTRMLVDIHHQSHFLMPVVDLINGKSLLADINAQYGVGVHYLIGMLFLWNPLLISFPAFTFVTNLGELALAAGLFVLAGRVSRWSASYMLLIGVVMALHRFGNVANPSAYASTGAIRFGLGWLAIACLTSRRLRRHPRAGAACLGLVAGLASVHSLEVFIYTTALVVCGLGMEWVRHQVSGDGGGVVPVGRVTHPRLALMPSAVAVGAGMVGFHVALLLDVVRRSGHLPDWRHYTQYLSVYDGGFGFVPPEVRSPWLAMFLVCAITLIVVGAQWASRLTEAVDADAVPVAETVILTAVYGMLQFSYFAFRSHPNNLYHLMYPVAIIAVYWLHRLQQRGGDLWDGPMMPLVAGAIVAVSMVMARGASVALASYGSTGIGWLQAKYTQGAGPVTPVVPTFAEGIRTTLYPPVGDDVVELRSLVEGYIPSPSPPIDRRSATAPTGNADGRIAMIIEPDLDPRARVGTTIVNRLPLSLMTQDGYIPVGREAALQSVRDLPMGSLLIIDQPDLIGDLGGEMAGVLCERGALRVIEKRTRIAAVRLAPRDEATALADWCPR
ncbi:MAG: hypothetical protein EBT00_11790 [Proteobacteria bacterium]|nr:hypothetical protein [Pseudomonadota bacterium]